MNPLVVFYSRTGATKRVGETLAEMLDCDSEELLDTKKRSEPPGFLLAGKDATAKKLTKLTDIKRDPALYDLINTRHAHLGRHFIECYADLYSQQ